MDTFKSVLKYTGVVAATAATVVGGIAAYHYFTGSDVDEAVKSAADAAESVAETLS